MQLPAPELQPTQQAQQEETQGEKKLTDGERLAQRIAIKQAFLSSIGIDWEPDDEDVQREMQSLPKDGSIVSMPTFEMPKLPEKEEAQEPAPFSFTPEEEVDDPMTDEEIAELKASRKAKKEQATLAGINPLNKRPTPQPGPLLPGPPPNQPILIPNEVIGPA